MPSLPSQYVFILAKSERRMHAGQFGASVPVEDVPSLDLRMVRSLCGKAPALILLDPRLKMGDVFLNCRFTH